MPTTRMQHRVDSELKKEAEYILAEQGIRPAQAITIFYTEIKRTGGLPFLPTKVPNKRLAEDLRGTQIKQNLKKYASKKALFDSLNDL